MNPRNRSIAERRRDLKARNFPTAQQEAEKPTPPSRYDGPESAYRLAFTDTEFLLREDLRPVRMQLELLKPELVQQEQKIESTIVIFGSARIVPIRPSFHRQVTTSASAVEVRVTSSQPRPSIVNSISASWMAYHDRSSW